MKIHSKGVGQKSTKGKGEVPMTRDSYHEEPYDGKLSRTVLETSQMWGNPLA